MSWKTVVAIYLLFWVMSAFLVLPFEAKAVRDQRVEPVAGQEFGAPAVWRPGRVALWTTIVSSVLFGLFYANYLNGWITVDMLDVTRI
jgi:predicted secreted protein